MANYLLTLAQESVHIGSHIYLDEYNSLDNGFYDMFRRVFIDDYGNKLDKEPEIYNASGMSGIGGVGSLIYKELLLHGYDVPWIDALEDN